MEFLHDHELRPLELVEAHGFRALGLALGKGAQPVEVAVIQATRRPSGSELRALWKARLKGRATPLLLVALYDERAALCGPRGEHPPAFPDLDAERVERICRTALEEPDRLRRRGFSLRLYRKLKRVFLAFATQGSSRLMNWSAEFPNAPIGMTR